MTKEQQKAATYLWQDQKAQTLQLIAGAGSGKTTTLLKSVQTFKESELSYGKICLITFTKKAALEMKERLAESKITADFVGTMHSLAYDIVAQNKQMKQSGQTGQIKERLNIIQDSGKIYNQLIQDKYPDLKYIPAEFLFYGEMSSNPQVIQLLEDYKNYKKQRQLYDFDDLIAEATYSLQQGISTSPYDVVLVDEFQDTSPSQLVFIEALHHKKLFVVGDDWQSIYKFRGADVSISINFSQRFSNVQRLFLTKNFRSQKRVVQLGNQTIKLSKEYISKKLVSHHKAESRPVCHIIYKRKGRGQVGDEPENDWKKLMQWNDKKKNHYTFTVLVRTNKEKNRLAKIIPTDFQVLTIHSSKGLEFDHVIIWGISEGNIPHRWGDFDEEVRLLYVGITRAKLSLQFLAKEEENKQSSFLPFLTSNCKVNYLV